MDFILSAKAEILTLKTAKGEPKLSFLSPDRAYILYVLILDVKRVTAAGNAAHTGADSLNHLRVLRDGL